MRKLAHIRALGYGLRTWDSPRYMIPGLSLSHSIYDRPTAALDEQLHGQVRGGIYQVQDRLPLKEPSTTREALIGAQFSSLANAHGFQGGWSTGWGHLTMRPNLSETRTLTKNNNRNAYGRAEGQRATIYNPWPSAGALYPKAI